jgi:hypothetical protein
MAPTEFYVALLNLVTKYREFWDDCKDCPILGGTGNPFKEHILWPTDLSPEMEQWLVKCGKNLCTIKLDPQCPMLALWKKYAGILRDDLKLLQRVQEVVTKLGLDSEWNSVRLFLYDLNRPSTYLFSVLD